MDQNANNIFEKMISLAEVMPMIEKINNEVGSFSKLESTMKISPCKGSELVEYLLECILSHSGRATVESYGDVEITGEISLSSTDIDYIKKIYKGIKSKYDIEEIRMQGTIDEGVEISIYYMGGDHNNHTLYAISETVEIIQHIRALLDSHDNMTSKQQTSIEKGSEGHHCVYCGYNMGLEKICPQCGNRDPEE